MRLASEGTASWGRKMKLFATDDEIAVLNTKLATETSPQLATLVPLVWAMRQRDGQPATRGLLEQAIALLLTASLSEQEHHITAARLTLVRAEMAWLASDLSQAEALLANALADFALANDVLGQGDAYWLAASLLQDKGEQTQAIARLEAARACYEQVGDADRSDAAVARIMWYSVFADPIKTRADLAERFGRASHSDAAVATWLEGTKAIIADFAGHFGESIAYFMHAYTAALKSGQYRIAIMMATNAGDKFVMLNDLAAALEWDERGLELARKTGWPVTIGQSLMQAGNALRLLGRTDEAHMALTEAMHALEPINGSRSYAIALGYLGELALDQKHYTVAEDWFLRDEACVGIRNQPDMLIGCRHGLARALSGLGRLAEAIVKAESALVLAREHGNVEGQISALRVLADLYRRHAGQAGGPSDFLAPALAVAVPENGHDVQHALLAKLVAASKDSNADAQKHALRALAECDERLPCSTTDQAGKPLNIPLYYLELALAVSATVAGYVFPTELLDELSREYAAAGDYHRAYETLVAACEAKKNKFTQEAIQRSIAMQMLLEAKIAGDGRDASRR